MEVEDRRPFRLVRRVPSLVVLAAQPADIEPMFREVAVVVGLCLVAALLARLAGEFSRPQSAGNGCVDGGLKVVSEMVHLTTE
jgi:hypothetical protein